MNPAEPFATLTGRTAVVTGGARGIGLRIAETLQSVGMTIVLLDRDADELDSAVAALVAAGPVTGVVADVGSGEGFDALAGCLGGLPPLAIWVNNAGVVSHQAAEDVDIAVFEQVVRTNAAGALRGSQQAFRHMREGTGSRAIVNITSLVVDKVLPQRLSYAASKATLESVTRYTAQEWGPFGIRVNAVSPGYIDTRLTRWAADDPRRIAKEATLRTLALPRSGADTDIANTVLYLGSPLADYVTGQILHVDGGWHLL